MVVRALLLGSLPLICACANEPGPKVMGYQSSVVPLSITAAQAAPVANGSLQQPMPARKNMADKVLAAIALERVTGRKPDPSRLTSDD